MTDIPIVIGPPLSEEPCFGTRFAAELCGVQCELMVTRKVRDVVVQAFASPARGGSTWFQCRVRDGQIVLERHVPYGDRRSLDKHVRRELANILAELGVEVEDVP